MTSTSFNVGLGEVSRNSSKVLKPPGGGSSDIFGVGAGEAQQSPRKVKQYMASNISLTDGRPLRHWPRLHVVRGLHGVVRRDSVSRLAHRVGSQRWQPRDWRGLQGPGRRGQP
ncbi:jupiter microtubule associated homolog 1-like isoform X2 [Thrips palmi]|uniref:Microtubule-associated protein Jupiter n=1 Tax=Thrips palmi TaxID=161013 RepID=A0A6P8ZVT7_THRPL|nr:jupiter microtubule associated homolog 1-like isoform X2 [Thrips palmi]